MSTSSTDANHVMGTINDVANSLYDELVTSNSSATIDDVIKVIVTNTEKYAGWSGEMQHCPSADKNCKSPLLTITVNTVIGVDDWIVIEPVVRAHCNLVQARRMEGFQGLGGQVSGLSSQEAEMDYREALERMKKEAFQFQPFTVEPITADGGIYARHSNIGLWGNLW